MRSILGIELHPSTVIEFIGFLTSSPHSNSIDFPEFRDFLLLMPRTASTSEIYKYYQTRKFLGDDGRGSARVNMEGACRRRSGTIMWHSIEPADRART